MRWIKNGALPAKSPFFEKALPVMLVSWRRPSPAIDEFLAVFLAGLWVLGIASIIWPTPLISFLAGTGMMLFLIPAFTYARLPTLLVGGMLFGAACALAFAYGELGSVWVGLERSILFTAFLPTLSLLRASARGDARLEGYRKRIERVPASWRSAWIVSGGFALASVLSVGASTIFAPLLREGASEGERVAQARANVCGSSLAVIWSPFFIALAVVSDFLPGVPLAALIPAGAAIGGAGMLLAIRVYAPTQPLIRIGAAIGALASFAPPIIVITALVIAVRGTTALSTIETMLLILPVLCLIRITTRTGGSLLGAKNDVWAGMLRMRDDIAIVSAAMVFGTVLTTAQWIEDLAPAEVLGGVPEGILMVATILVMAGSGFVGVQPLVAGTVCLVILTGLDLEFSELAIGLTVLVGWSSSSMLSLSSLLVRVTAGQYGVLPEQLVVGRNIVFFAAFLPLSLLLIWLFDNLVSAFPTLGF